MRQLPDCLCDQWTLQLREDFPSLQGDVVVAVIQLALQLIRADISHIEAKHASVRRVALMRSLQTWLVDLPDLSAQFVVLQARASAKRTRRRTRRSKCSRKRKSSHQEPKRRRASIFGKRRDRHKYSAEASAALGGLGCAWGCRGERPGGSNMAEVSRAYRAAKRARTREFEDAADIGAAMTQVARNRAKAGSAAPPMPRVRSRARKLDNLGNILRSLSHDLDATTKMMLLSSAAASQGAAISDMLSVARHAARAQSLQAKPLEEG